MKGLSCNRTKKEVKNGETVISTTTYGYNDGNQLTSINSQPLIYDNNGNLTDDGIKLYTWDAAGRLIEVRNKADNSLIAQYEYDYLGRRIKSTANGVVTNYHYDGGSINVLYETDASNSLTNLYTYSADGMLLSMTKVDGANKVTYYYHYNAHGDVVKLTAQDGTEVASYIYDAWGNILSSSGAMAEENPYRYAGYRYDSDINLYYLMARYYNPETGRFLSEDPIPALNLYVYSANNPVMNVDPTGLAHEIGGGGGYDYKPEAEASNSYSYASGNSGPFYGRVLNYDKDKTSLSASIIEGGVETVAGNVNVKIASGSATAAFDLNNVNIGVGLEITLHKYEYITPTLKVGKLKINLAFEAGLGSIGVQAYLFRKTNEGNRKFGGYGGIGPYGLGGSLLFNWDN